MYYLCLTWTVNANSLKQNIIVIKKTIFWLPPSLDEKEISAYRKVAANGDYTTSTWCSESMPLR